MNSKTKKEKISVSHNLKGSSKVILDNKNQPNNSNRQNIEELCDENLETLGKIHAILKNCVNLSKKQKLEFAENERYFMKLYLKKLNKKLKE
ncbi:MAG: hypothetical protein ACFFDH_07500 [Promethearchaeota archaeon]